MSTFQDEWQRRLRAVLADRTGWPVPDDAVVTVEVDATVEGGCDCCGTTAEIEVALRTPVLPDRYLRRATDDRYGCVDRLLADVMAVPARPDPQEKP